MTKTLSQLARILPPVGLTLLLTACTTVQTERQQTPPPPVERAEIVRVEPVRPNLELTEDMLYKLLVAEFAGYHGKTVVSVENYLELAHATQDHKIAERATRIAVYARDDVAAAEAAGLWVKLDPLNPDPHQILAVVELRRGNTQQALQHLQSILDYTRGELNQKLWMIANMLGREKDVDMVLNVMQELVATRHGSADALYAFAHVAARLGQLERAAQLFAETLALAPDNDNAALSYISVLQRSGKEQEAVSWLEQALADSEENDFSLRLAYARLLTVVKRYDDARQQFELLAQQAPVDVDVLYALGQLNLQSNRLDEAKVYFERLTKTGRQTDSANYFLGRISEEQQDYVAAGRWYQGVHKGENYFDARVRLALLQAKLGELEKARQSLRQIQTGSERQVVILAQAEAELFIEEKRYAEALDVYDKALLHRYDADLLYARAMVAEKMDRLDILEADLRRVIEKDPDHASALNALGYTLADRTTRYDEAYDLIKRALELSPNDFYILDSMGWVLYRLGRLDESISHLRQAMALRQDPEIAAHLGEVLWVKGEREEAIGVWETALKITPDDAILLDVIKRFQN
ncbi:MAG: tetratricopeptide repeat protein [Gammaproteobacteria bacterium]